MSRTCVSISLIIWYTEPLADVRAKAIDVMAEWGGKIVEPEYTKGVSSSMIKKKIREQ